MGESVVRRQGIFWESSEVNNECYVQCLEKPFRVKEPQSLEKDSQAVFYEKVFETDVQPKLTKVGRGWKYTY